MIRCSRFGLPHRHLCQPKGHAKREKAAAGPSDRSTSFMTLPEVIVIKVLMANTAMI
jgi:hypothetical protein